MLQRNQSHIFRGTRTSLCAFPKLARGDSGPLDNGIIAWTGGVPIVVSLSPDTVEKAEQLISFAQTLQIPKTSLRFVFNQVDSAAFEWDSITKEHRALIHLNEEKLGKEAFLIHLSTPCDPFFAPSAPVRPVSKVAAFLEKLPKLMNSEGWADFLAWYQLLIEETFSQELYEAVDAYTLEKHLKDFEHEVDSYLLKRGRRHLLMLQLSLGRPENPASKGRQQLIDIEKEMIVLRQELLSQVSDHYRALKEIIQTIPIIEEAHPQLKRIKFCGTLLKALLGNQVEELGAHPHKWGVQQMLLQLLEAELGIVTFIHQADVFHRSFLALAIRSVILQFKEEFSLDEAIGLALHWEEAVKHVNLIAAKNGSSALLEPSLDVWEKRVLLFRERVHAFLQKCCVPLVGDLAFAPELTQGTWISPELLNYLPSFVQGNPWVEYELSNGEPKGIKEEGHAFLLSFCR